MRIIARRTLHEFVESRAGHKDQAARKAALDVWFDEAALAEIKCLWGARISTLEGDRLDIWATLVDAYENEHWPMDPPDPIEAIKFRMEQQGLTRKGLAGILESRARVAEVLNRRRGLSIHMIRSLHEKLGISVEVLVRPTRTKKAA